VFSAGSFKSGGVPLFSHEKKERRGGRTAGGFGKVLFYHLAGERKKADVRGRLLPSSLLGEKGGEKGDGKLVASLFWILSHQHKKGGGGKKKVK